MSSNLSKRAYVVGSGPNGFSAAILLARAGLSVTLIEGHETVGGGARSAELTLPGFIHDVCSAAHPMAASSPVFAEFPLAEHRLEWIQPPGAVAHPFDDGPAAVLYPSVKQTFKQFQNSGGIYRAIVESLAPRWDRLCRDILKPMVGLPSHPAIFAEFGMIAPWPATWSARAAFREPRLKAFFAGIAAHSILPLETFGSGAFGWVLGVAGHTVGWPVARGGSQSITNALCRYFRALGGQVETRRKVESLDELENAGIVLLDVTPRQLLRIAGKRLPSGYAAQLSRYRYGPGVFKIDWALDGPIPWKASECSLAGTVHLGGSLEEIAASERASWNGEHSGNPFVLVTQPSLFDSTRAPAGRHTAWAYCHVPNGSPQDQTEIIERQMERFAPGFKDRVLGRHVMGPAALEKYNPNLVGGDITGGAATLRQLFLRPTRSTYRTPLPGVYLCSSSTPPGGGVHGMCGYHAAQMALKDAGRKELRP